MKESSGIGGVVILGLVLLGLAFAIAYVLQW
jgi:hypothetical protein